MPTYQYACTECGHRFEAVQSFHEDSLTHCPVCDGRLRKVFNAVGVVFKGSGFYRTDSRTDGKPASQPASTSGADSSSAKSDSSSSSSTESSDSGSSSAKQSSDSGSSSSPSKESSTKSSSAKESSSGTS